MAALRKITLARKLARQAKFSCAYFSKNTYPLKPPPEVELEEMKSKLPEGFLESKGQFYRDFDVARYKEPEDDRDFIFEMLTFLHKDYDFTIKGFKNWRTEVAEKKVLFDQRFIQAREDILGPDLAAAHFLVHRGGGVKFKDFDMWFRKDAKGKYFLPRKYIPNLYLEAIDVQNVPIVYAGLPNLDNLKFCKWASFRDCQNVDDYFLDWIGVYKDTLEYLDISGCPRVTERGVSSLVRLRNLKVLNLSNLNNLKHPQLVCLLLDDELPNLKILGIDYMNPSILQLSHDNNELIDTQTGDEIYILENLREKKQVGN